MKSLTQRIKKIIRLWQPILNLQNKNIVVKLKKMKVYDGMCIWGQKKKDIIITIDPEYSENELWKNKDERIQHVVLHELLHPYFNISNRDSLKHIILEGTIDKTVKVLWKLYGIFK